MRTLWDFRCCWRGSAGPCGHCVTSHIEGRSAIRVHRRHVTEPHGCACGRHPDCSETGLQSSLPAGAGISDLSLRGRISYINPQVNPETHIAKIRVKVPNSRGELRLRMYVNVTVTGARGTSVPVVPATPSRTSVIERLSTWLIRGSRANSRHAGCASERPPVNRRWPFRSARLPPR
jgi:hypothetical protein